MDSLAFAVITEIHLVASRLEVIFSNATPVGFRKSPLRRRVMSLDVYCPNAVIGHAPLMLPLSASPALQSSTLVRLCAWVELALRISAVTNIAVLYMCVTVLVISFELMHQPLLVVAIARRAFAVFQNYVIPILVLLTLLQRQECNAPPVVAVIQRVARELVLLISVVRVTRALTQPLFALEAFAVLPCAVQ